MSGQLQSLRAVSDPHLSPKQQDLLLAALRSHARASTTHTVSPSSRLDSYTAVGNATSVLQRSPTDLNSPDTPTMATTKSKSLFMSPHQADLDSSFADYTPDLDYLDGDFDFENADLGGDMIGALPGSAGRDSPGSQSSPDGARGDTSEKRKSRDETSEIGGDAKRQETQGSEKTAKKPGRKPLKDEPTTKRKAQNRAAQRAFRERKEKHLKDLETKVSELTKASEADKHENGLLKAQVQRLQSELRDYRKRLALDSSINRSPPSNPQNPTRRSASGSSRLGGDFQFDFPKFGSLPRNHMGNDTLVRKSTSPPVTQSNALIYGMLGQSTPPQSAAGRHGSLVDSMSPASKQGSNTQSPPHGNDVHETFAPYSTSDNMHGFADATNPLSASADPFVGLFSPSILQQASASSFFESPSISTEESQNRVATDGGVTTAGLNRVFQFNGGSNASDSASPSACSSNQWTANGAYNSSVGTSPEPSLESPAHKDNKTPESSSQKSNSEPQSSRTEPKNAPQTGLDSMFGFGNADFNLTSTNDFDPILFGSYRDGNEAKVGGGDFTGGFFDDALTAAPFDYASPSNLFGILSSPRQTHPTSGTDGLTNAPTPSKSLMEQIEKNHGDGDDDYGLPSSTRYQQTDNGLVSCNKIWTQLQSNPDFVEGKFDLDSLCSELRTKARCSESGVMVTQTHVDAALRKLGKKDEDGRPYKMPSFVFDHDSWIQAYDKASKPSV